VNAASPVVGAEPLGIPIIALAGPYGGFSARNRCQKPPEEGISAVRDDAVHCLPWCAKGEAATRASTVFMSTSKSRARLTAIESPSDPAQAQALVKVALCVVTARLGARKRQHPIEPTSNP
jgi:hypothetical protein